MTAWEKVLILPETTIMNAISIIDTSALRIALVVDHERRLLGTVTDGDIRRGILKGLSLDSNVTEIMYHESTTVKQGVDKEIIISLMKTKNCCRYRFLMIKTVLSALKYGTSLNKDSGQLGGPDGRGAGPAVEAAHGKMPQTSVKGWRQADPGNDPGKFYELRVSKIYFYCKLQGKND